LFDSPEKASAAVKEYNASRGGDAFHKSVEASKERVKVLLPSEKLSVKDVVGKSDDDMPSGKTQRLLKLLEKEASESECSLDRIAEICPTYQLDWRWVEDQLNKLANRGILIFPRPWTVKLVDSPTEDKAKVPLVDVTKDILLRLQELGGEARVDDVIEHFEQMGILQESVEASLDRLMNQGAIYVPKTGTIGLV
jgi:DNA replicative helicase MCM subunit Mcm2 (Cdc46/Mcm family)